MAVGGASSCTRDHGRQGQEIVFATHGLGAEGDATTRAVREFEQQNPDVRVRVRQFEANSTRALDQLERSLHGREQLDVLTLDVIWVSHLAESGSLLELARFHPDLSRFIPAQAEAGKYHGSPFAIPWFLNVEGLYYRTDLVPRAPRSPEDLVTAARHAMAIDPAVTTGFAFAGSRFEGAVTVFINVLGGFGGELDAGDLPGSLNTPEALAALTFLADATLHNGITPTAVTRWQEQDVAEEFLAGRAAFAMNWPYLFATASRSALRGKFDWIPFPAGDHQPVATFGGSMLAVTRTTRNPEVAWRLIDHLTSDSVEVERAIMTGDPPSLPSAYSDQLIAEAPQFGKQRAVFGHLTPRPGVSNYLDVSAVLQDMLSTALSGAQSPATALAHAASRIETLTPAS